MKFILISISVFFLWTHSLTAQTITAYTTAQAHSHNDYEQKRPFFEAYEQQFGSIEADLFLVDGALYAAHNRVDITPDRTFKRLYLEPILSQIEKNKGNIYAQQDLTLQLLIDLKTPAEETLEALVATLNPYEQILAPKGPVKIVVSGNTPSPEAFDRYPSFIFFDGRPENTYTPDQLKRIGLISQAFQKYSKWNGEGDLPEKEKKAVIKVIEQTHQLGKKVRFWATPDNIQTWKTMMSLKADYLNTDKVMQLGDYLRTAPR
ncbi:phosphatidylinositol-specific phospholipase C/glycerophosphodiester phosphodiesterase family protein [Dyadobacter psychrotolerans]|uniref:Altered inheritance of mitochondria protein 6 n=1 Tax=Dyadobacter psychrotolerans TaxID=2541721 RepID=A0A4R5E1I9_9BACT|nr:phosphatidylinositol-specific phospholipase C/glycerophosphodiester phosphodiesterase family protein [Dyadobacter psychrotolerans]TDE18581.1 alkaline phosphatase [Dyadobacter psychrotolerans]